MIFIVLNYLSLSFLFPSPEVKQASNIVFPRLVTKRFFICTKLGKKKWLNYIYLFDVTHETFIRDLHNKTFPNEIHSYLFNVWPYYKKIEGQQR